jgi:hypothetical protein
MEIMLRKTFYALILAAMVVSPAWAVTDYSSMTTEELSQLRGTLRDATQEERDAFRAVWQERVRNMSTEEMQRYIGPSASRAAAANTGVRQGMGGQGRGMRAGGGQGRGRGMGGNCPRVK